MNDDTIVAIATAAGQAGVGIVRLSGALAYSIALRINQNQALTPRYAHFLGFYDQNAELIDQGVVLYFPGPRSFTGEDVVEFHGHGSPVVLERLVRMCVDYGARMATAGEFSLRAFLNGKMDLTQAEAIADLIHAGSEAAAKMAVRALQGEFSRRIYSLSEQLLQLRIYVEAAIDFPEEEVDFLSNGRIESLLCASMETLETICDSVKQGVMIQEGLYIVIAGKPNAGKSTLMNALSGKDIAIVTDIPGTTRDVMRERVLLDDIPIHLIDTAGLRDSTDAIEQEGIKRAYAEISKADCVLWVLDVTNEDISATIEPLLERHVGAHVPIIRVFNKIDLLHKAAYLHEDAVYLCAKEQQGLSLLKKAIQAAVGLQPLAEGQFIARRRHLQALLTAKQHVLLGLEQLRDYRAAELLAEELRLAHRSLASITGELTADDLLGCIFSSFCIGK